MNYKVTISETLRMRIDVEAESKEEAEQIVSDAWQRGDYILDAESFEEVNFEADEVTENKKETEKEKSKERYER